MCYSGKGMVREIIEPLRRRMAPSHREKITMRTVIRIWLLVATVCLLVVNSRFSHEEELYLRGEVTGDLDTEGVITRAIVAQNTSSLGHVYISNWDGPSKSACHILITLANLSNVTVFEADYSNDTRTCTTLEIPAGILDVGLEGGGFEGSLSNANITMVFSEFRGEAEGEHAFMNDPYYETISVISKVTGNATIPPNGEILLSYAHVRYNGTIVNVTMGGLIFPDNVTARVLLDCTGRLHGSGAMLGDNKDGVHLDGRVTIRDFHERDEHGDRGHYHELLTLRGDDIEIITLEQPYSWSHWYENLEPWTIEVRSRDAVSLSSINPTSILIECSVLWIITILGAHIWKRQQRLRTDGTPSADGIQFIIRPTTGIAEQTLKDVEIAVPRKDGLRAKAAIAGGALCIINGAIVLVLTSYYQSIEGFTTVCMIFGVINPLFSIIGGAFAILRYRYGLAVMGALFTMVSPGFAVAGPVCMPVPFVGIIALGLIIAGRKSFNAASGQSPQSKDQSMIL